MAEDKDRDERKLPSVDEALRMASERAICDCFPDGPFEPVGDVYVCTQCGRPA